MKSISFVILVLVLFLPKTSGATTINFDYWPDGNSIPAPPDAPYLSITDEFAEWGIIFESTTHIMQHSAPGDLDTPPNCVQPDHGSGSELWEDSITLDAHFVDPGDPNVKATVTWVQFFQDRGAQSGGGTFIAYDICGNEVINETFHQSGKTFHTFNDWGYVGEIHRIYIGYCKDGLDDLTFPTPTPEPALVVEIDIKPGSYPNAINLGSHGLTPVAIFSEVGFDATSVDPNSVNLAGAPVAIRGKDKFMAHEEDIDGDGLVDLVVQVVTADINPALLQKDGDVIYAVLTGNTSGGQNIEGEDEIIIVPPEKE